MDRIDYILSLTGQMGEIQKFGLEGNRSNGLKVSFGVILMHTAF